MVHQRAGDEAAERTPQPATLSAFMRQYPNFRSFDFGWFQSILDSLPIESKTELKMRKAGKYLEYGVLESIPRKLLAERLTIESKNPRVAARRVMHELIMNGSSHFLGGNGTCVNVESVALHRTFLRPGSRHSTTSKSQNGSSEKNRKTRKLSFGNSSSALKKLRRASM